MGHVYDHIGLELVANSNATVDDLCNSLHTVMRLNNNRTRRIRYFNREIEPVTPLARSMSYMRTFGNAAAAMQEALQERRGEDNSGEEGVFTSTAITDLDEVQPRTAERLVRRCLARNRPAALESSDDVEML